MKVDGKLGAGPAAAVIEEARRHEKAGYDGLWSSESAHDPFLPLVLAAEHTERTGTRHGHRGGLRPLPHAARLHRA